MRSLLALTLALPVALAACTSGDAPEAPAALPVQSSMDAGRAAPSPPDADHVEVAPHGGTVAEAGEGHLELVVDGASLLVYPLDDRAEPISADGIRDATAVLHPVDGAVQTLPLVLTGDHLQVTVPDGMTAFSADVTVPMAGETREAHFEVGLDGDFDHAH